MGKSISDRNRDAATLRKKRQRDKARRAREVRRGMIAHPVRPLFRMMFGSRRWGR